MSTALIKPKANWKRISHPMGGDWFKWGDVSVLIAQEPVGPNGALRWHLSISVPYRYPTWDEIKAARYDLLPHDISMAMILPPPTEYVNVHENCFHLHEMEPER
jgi:hypothetical protein